MNVLMDIIKSVYGWLLISATAILNFFEPEKWCFTVVYIFVLLDLFWAIVARVKLKEFILSDLIKKTPVKVLIYGTILAGVYIGETVLHDDSFFVIRGVTVLMCVCELWSISAWMLIVKPDMMFLKIFRLQLKGEIERKIGKNADNILNEN
jgi:hypothetical protein